MQCVHWNDVNRIFKRLQEVTNYNLYRMGNLKHLATARIYNETYTSTLVFGPVIVRYTIRSKGNKICIVAIVYTTNK